MTGSSHRTGQTVDTESAIGASGLAAVKVSLALVGLVFVLMMLLGLTMRAAQGALVAIPPDLFYQIMTAHGVGMVGAAGIGGATIMWYFLNRHLDLSDGVFWLNLGLFLFGVVLILSGIFLTGFAAGWTFLYPLPALSGGVWTETAAALFLVGLLIVGVGFLLLHLDIGRAVVARHGNLARALGWPQLFAGEKAEAPPPAIVASTAVLIVNILGIVVGAAILVISLINLYAPGFQIDPLLAKNLIFFFGHVFINATIYMSVIAVYEIIPDYTGRPWRSTKPLLIGWTATLLMVMAVYPHHLFQDTVMPAWSLVLGQVLSYASGIPIIVVTTLGLLSYLYRSQIRWDLATGLLVLGVFGWAGGAVPAIIDGTISVNKVMHNTLWVPGHFHFYLLLGMVAMLFGFMAWFSRGAAESGFRPGGLIAFLLYAVGGLGLTFVFLYGGLRSVPRRWAVHLPEWVAQDRLAVVFAAAVVTAALLFWLRFLRSRHASAGGSDA